MADLTECEDLDLDLNDDDWGQLESDDAPTSEYAYTDFELTLSRIAEEVGK